MPEELWEAAAALARAHGIYPVARALRVNYESLKGRAGPAVKDGDGGGAGSAGFIELAGTQLVGSSGPAETVVEVVDSDGAKLTIRLAGREGPDVLGLVEGFWRRRS